MDEHINLLTDFGCSIIFTPNAVFSQLILIKKNPPSLCEAPHFSYFKPKSVSVFIVKSVSQEVIFPILIHTHDTGYNEMWTGRQAASYKKYFKLYL